METGLPGFLPHPTGGLELPEISGALHVLSVVSGLQRAHQKEDRREQMPTRGEWITTMQGRRVPRWMDMMVAERGGKGTALGLVERSKDGATVSAGKDQEANNRAACQPPICGNVGDTHPSGKRELTGHG